MKKYSFQHKILIDHLLKVLILPPLPKQFKLLSYIYIYIIKQFMELAHVICRKGQKRYASKKKL